MSRPGGVLFRVVSLFRALRNHKRPFRLVISRLLMYSGACRLLSIRQPGFRMRFHASNLAAMLWLDPEHELDRYHGGEEMAFVRRALRPGDIAIDVGANIGHTALVCSTVVGRTGHVYAIEPHPRVYHFLRDNVDLNGFKNITTIQCAVADYTGAGHITSKRADNENALARAGLAVPVYRLDEVSAVPGKSIRLLKIDTEGSELLVLRGASGLLPAVELIYFESIERHYNAYAYSLPDVTAFLAEHGFRTYRLGPDREYVPVDETYTSRHYENLVAAKAQVRVSSLNH